MQIIDLNGKTLSISNLDAAIEQAELFKELRHESSKYARLDKNLKDYWTDVYDKLLKLKMEVIETKQ